MYTNTNDKNKDISDIKSLDGFRKAFTNSNAKEKFFFNAL